MKVLRFVEDIVFKFKSTIFAGLAVVVLATAPSWSQDLLGGGGGLISLGSGSAGDSSLVNVGLGGGDGNVLDLNVGGSGGGEGGLLSANVSSGGSSGQLLGVDANLGGALGAGIDLGGGGGLLDVDVDIGLGGGGGNGGGGNGGNGGNGGFGPGSNGGNNTFILNGGGGVRSSGGGGGINFAGNSACAGSSANQLIGVFQSTDMSGWNRASNIQLVPLRVCAQLRSQVANWLLNNGQYHRMIGAVAGDPLINAALSRTRYQPGHVLGVQRSGSTLTVYVF